MKRTDILTPSKDFIRICRRHRDLLVEDGSGELNCSRGCRRVVEFDVVDRRNPRKTAASVPADEATPGKAPAKEQATMSETKAEDSAGTLDSAAFSWGAEQIKLLLVRVAGNNWLSVRWRLTAKVTTRDKSHVVARRGVVGLYQDLATAEKVFAAEKERMLRDGWSPAMPRHSRERIAPAPSPGTLAKTGSL